ncbi:3'-5' exonuclease [Micromonospora purpureochromogenes]|uniref:3'-5' exonuclease n=1 Tax=Micromonospora purpureochromogenes TaxID=47872 RepID=UPI00331F8CC9
MPVSDPTSSFGPTNHPLGLFRPGYLSRINGMPLRDLEFVALDFETTGLKGRTDRIVEVAACRFRADGTILDEYASRVAPGRRRVGDSRFYHGLTDADLKGAPRFGEVWPELRRLLSGAVVVAHNLRFEDDFLRHELGRIQVDLAEPPPGVCTMVASWTHFRQFNYKQKNVFRTVVGAWPRDAHTALGDVRNLSAILAALYRRMPDLCYVGPPPVVFDADSARGPMCARPAVEAAFRWNSLPLSTTDHPVSDTAAAALRTGCLRLLGTYRRRDRRQLLIELMAGVGVGANQFIRLFGTTMAAVLAEDPGSLDFMCLDLLGDLMEELESAEFAEILTDAVLTGQSCKGMPVPVLDGERWRVPKEHPEREYLDTLLTSLGAQVLLTVRPNLDARVVGQRVHRDTVLDLHTYLADIRRRSVQESAAYLRDWAEERRGRYGTTIEIPRGTTGGGDEWDRIMAFEPRDPELAPDWRWAAKGFRGDPKSWAHLDRTPGFEDDDERIEPPEDDPDSADGETVHVSDQVASDVHRVVAPPPPPPVRGQRPTPCRPSPVLPPAPAHVPAVEEVTERALLLGQMAVALRTVAQSRTDALEAAPQHGHGGSDDSRPASSPPQQSAPTPGFKRFLLSLVVLGFTCFGWPFDGIPRWVGVMLAVVLFISAVAA